MSENLGKSASNNQDLCGTDIESSTQEMLSLVQNSSEVTAEMDLAAAPDVVWTGAGGDSSWTNPKNWSTGKVPGADDNVVINGTTNGPMIDMSGAPDIYVQNITITGKGTNLQNVHSITAHGNINVESSSGVNITGDGAPVQITADTLSLGENGSLAATNTGSINGKFNHIYAGSASSVTFQGSPTALTVSVDYSQPYTDGGSVQYIPPPTGGEPIKCFLTGTMIMTPQGERPVEALKVGDQITVHEEGGVIAKELIWVGNGHVTVRPCFPDDEAGYPIRILKDAVALGVPSQDLLVTAEHCLAVSGGFIPARMLVNERTIFYDRTLTDYTYYHIETRTHSVIVANNMETESYLHTDTHGRFNRESRPVALSGVDAPLATWEHDAALPLTVTRDKVEAVYNRFIARALQLGYVCRKSAPKMLTKEPELVLMTEEGEIFTKTRERNGYNIFLLPERVTQVYVTSRTSRPADVIGPFVDDRRQLGVLVGEVSFWEGVSERKIEAHLQDTRLLGWDVQEHSPCRWTKGHALLPLGPRAAGQVGLLALKILAAGPYVHSPVSSRA